MNQCNCKICRNNLTDIVNSKGNDNISFLAIKKYLIDSHELDVTENVVKRHLKAYGIDGSDKGTNPTNTVIVEANEGVIDKRGNVTIDLNDISLDNYDFDESDPRTIVRYLQRTHLGLYLKQLEIAYQEITEYQLGIRENYPTVAVNNLKKLFELLDSITGISIYSNQQAAIKTVESMGLRIDRFESFVLPEIKEI